MDWGLVWPIAAAQLVSWGSIYYAFTLFLEPMSRELGWSQTQLAAAFSLGLATSGLTAIHAGRWIDRHGGRLLMTAGSAAAGLLMLAWSRVESYPAFVAIWIGLGATMSAVLYEPAFAVLTRSLGPHARRGITWTTFVGGLASTAFIPLTFWLVQRLGWRDALLVLAGFNLAFCALIHLAVVPGSAGRAEAAGAAASGSPGVLRAALRVPAFWGLVAAVLANAVVFAGLSVHLLPLLVQRGYAPEAAVAAIALVGPAQVAARIGVALTENRVSLRPVAMATAILPVLALLALAGLPEDSWLVVPFAIVYGAANGMMTIVRAVITVELFGREGYATVQGAIALPTRLAQSVAPFAVAALAEASGSYVPVIWGLAAVAAAAALVFALAAPREGAGA